MINADVLIRLEAISDEIATWATRNFGENKTKAIGAAMPVDTPLGSLMPLLGIGEESGEQEKAENANDYADAIGDIAIYAMDYARRESLNLTTITNHLDAATLKLEKLSHRRAIHAAIGGLMHATLKRHQGIRMMDDYNVYKQKRDASFCLLLLALDAAAANKLEKSLHSILLLTWGKVKKRDWVASPAEAGAVSEVAAVAANSTGDIFKAIGETLAPLPPARRTTSVNPLAAQRVKIED